MEQYYDILKKQQEPIKFALVGISGIVVNFIILFISKEIMNWSDEISLGLGIIFSVTTNYALNRIWTFQSNQPIFIEYLKYVATNFVGFTMQFLIAYAVVVFSPVDYLNVPIFNFNIDILYLGSLIGILLGFVSNFLFSKFFVFNTDNDKEIIQ